MEEDLTTATKLPIVQILTAVIESLILIINSINSRRNHMEINNKVITTIIKAIAEQTTVIAKEHDTMAETRAQNPRKEGKTK